MIKDRFLYNNQYCTVELTVNNNGEEFYHCLLLNQKKKELKLQKSISFFSIDKLFTFLKERKQSHLVLIINNNQVLAKKVKTSKNDNDIFTLAYPNLSSNDFYYQIEKSDEFNFIALARKDYLNDILDLFQKNGFFILDFSLENLSVFQISEFIDSDIFYTSNSKTISKSGSISDILKKEFQQKKYTINGLNINNLAILSLGGIIRFHLKKEIIQKTNHLIEFKNKQLFNYGFKGALTLCFAILLINFLVFNSYYRKVENLTNYIELNNNDQKEINTLANNVKEKEKLMNQIHGSLNSNISLYIDEITYLLPNSITLTKVNYQPFLNTIKEGKKVKNQLNTIAISGIFNNNNGLSIWIEELEKVTWINEVSELSIETKNKKSTFSFLIKIKNGL